MSGGSEFDDVGTDLHAAFGAEVADLDIGVTPVGAVMRGGAALRARRRATAVSGVAALAVLPVAAVAFFGGGGGAENGRTTESAGGAVTHSVAESPKSPTPRMTPSADIVLPQETLGGGDHTTPGAGQFTVITEGTLEGKHWRLVREMYVAPLDQKRLVKPGIQLPVWQLGSPGTEPCTAVGLQWGTRPPGTLPDFDAGGQCGPHLEDITGPMSLGPAGGSSTSGPDAWALVGRVADVTKVASVSVSGDREMSFQGTSDRQKVTPVPGEHDGYFVVFMPRLSAQDQQSLTITMYGPDGKVVQSTSLH